MPTSGKVLSNLSRKIFYMSPFVSWLLWKWCPSRKSSQTYNFAGTSRRPFHNRNTAVTVFLNRGNALSLSSTQALLSLTDFTSVNVSQETDSGDGVHDRSTPNSSLGVGSETTSELASSPEVQQLLHDMQILRYELRVLKEKRSLAPDED